MHSRSDANEHVVSEQLSLEQAATHVLEECRTIVPGIQAVFGFQLIAVFNTGFGEQLSGAEQRLHLGAIALVVMAMALVMAPAALHRQAEPRSVSERFLRVSSRLLMLSMAPLALGVSVDVYLVARVILGARDGAAALAGMLLVVLGTLWFVLPRSRRLQRLAGRGGAG
jgi:uncharacterized protein DUF6328